MTNIDRREWLKTLGLTGGLALLKPSELLALDEPVNTTFSNSPIMLNANENAYGPSERVKKVISDNLNIGCRYPFRSLSSLVDLIAEKEEIHRDSIVITGGSTEGLKATGLVYGLYKGEIIAADPTFQAMLSYAETFDAKVHRVPLNPKMEHDLDAMAAKVNKNTKLIFICNPNNPTGTLLDRNHLIDFCKAFDKSALIFSDEAYYDFITEADYPSMTKLVKEGRNVIVSKTFSKVYGLAGLRIGYLIAKPEIAKNLKAAVMANTNTLAIEAAKEALKDDAFYKYSITQNIKAKELIYKTLEDLGMEYIPSHTNFVFFKTGIPITSFSEQMSAKNIIVGRPFPPLLNWARISTGRLEDVKSFTTALKTVMG
ncbi:pyridoxal phosphate-dependent aminotransferase [Eudoraea chungangensis]|uniref:pyridoxal phosphate-dependent aminotransferase n=1 Tax=Eudoraea chungangensis TaxID=1481905 RepID=UPI0023EABDCE|nr:histidinol-phosphate transaminase [Eudoraea chungangensis]